MFELKKKNPTQCIFITLLHFSCVKFNNVMIFLITYGDNSRPA